MTDCEKEEGMEEGEPQEDAVGDAQMMKAGSCWLSFNRADASCSICLIRKKCAEETIRVNKGEKPKDINDVDFSTGAMNEESDGEAEVPFEAFLEQMKARFGVPTESSRPIRDGEGKDTKMVAVSYVFESGEDEIEVCHSGLTGAVLVRIKNQNFSEKLSADATIEDFVAASKKMSKFLK